MDEELLTIPTMICHFLMRKYISRCGVYHIPDHHMAQFPMLCDYIQEGRAIPPVVIMFRIEVHRVEGPRAIPPSDHVPYRDILHIKAKHVKLHGTPIVSSETTKK
jgi:hypothetical protein